jgi:hypothetical protein
MRAVDAAARAKQRPERNRFQVSEGIVCGCYVSTNEQHSRKKKKIEREMQKILEHTGSRDKTKETNKRL